MGRLSHTTGLATDHNNKDKTKNRPTGEKKNYGKDNREKL
jgi:hypothetical protein